MLGLRNLAMRWAARALASQRKDPRDAIRAKAIAMAVKMGRNDLVERLEG